MVLPLQPTTKLRVLLLEDEDTELLLEAIEREIVAKVSICFDEDALKSINDVLRSIRTNSKSVERLDRIRQSLLKEEAKEVNEKLPHGPQCDCATCILM